MNWVVERLLCELANFRSGSLTALSRTGQFRPVEYFPHSSHPIRIIITDGNRLAIYADIAVLYDMHVGQLEFRWQVALVVGCTGIERVSLAVPGRN